MLKLQVEELENTTDQLSERDARFARDLCRNYWDRGLSDRQAVWVERLLSRARGEEPEPPEAVQVAVNEIYSMMHTAAENLKWPKVLLHTPADGDVQFSVAGPRSNSPGSINVTDGGAYGSNRWYGRIHSDGQWRTPVAGVPEAIVQIVQRFAANPAGVAAEHGRASGHCCFCRKQLTDPRSMHVGYGPVCAGNWGLPWGHEDGPGPEPEDPYIGDEPNEHEDEVNATELSELAARLSDR
jgi:hypothetical protein